MQTFYTEIRFSKEIFDKDFPGDRLIIMHLIGLINVAVKSDKNVMMHTCLLSFLGTDEIG